MGETAEDDAGGRDAFVYFGFDEAVEVVSGFEDAGLVLGLGEVVEGDLVTLGDRLEGSVEDGCYFHWSEGSRSHNVVPAWHLHTEVLWRVLASMHRDSSLVSNINRKVSHTAFIKQHF